MMKRRSWIAMFVVLLAVVAIYATWTASRPDPGNDSTQAAAKKIVKAVNDGDLEALDESSISSGHPSDKTKAVKEFVQRHQRHDYRVVSAEAYFAKHSTVRVESGAGPEVWNLTWIDDERKYRLRLP